MKKNIVSAVIASAIALIVYLASVAGYAYPGEGARLMAVWRGLDAAAVPPYPLMGFFAKLAGAGNAMAPVAGALAVMLLSLLVSRFVFWRVKGENSTPQRSQLSLIAGAVTALVFTLTPAVRSAATHLEPRMFDFFWALLVFVPAAFLSGIPGGKAFFVPALTGVLAAFGFCDSPLLLALSPAYVAVVAMVAVSAGRKPYFPLFVFVLAALVTLISALNGFGVVLSDFMKNSFAEFRLFYSVPGWLFVAIFSTLPFVTAVFSSNKAFNEKPDLIQWLFHGAMTFTVILAVATPLSPSSLMEPYGILPVASSAFAAAVAGYLAAYWWLNRRTAVGIVAGSTLAFVIAVTSLWNLFTFDGDKGAFADKVAHKIIADLGERKWFVTDGTLDHHLMLAAAESGRELNIVSLARDLDKDYLERLGALVREKKVGGSKNGELTLSLSLGVLPFIQDWFASDPSVSGEVAIYGAPDIWYGAGLNPVPEFLFFGADDKRKPDWSVWKEYDALLEVPEGWGSYRSRKAKNPVDRLRHSIRRHIGLVANDRGVYYQDRGRNDEAFAMYELVLGSIDRDNLSALFNEIAMVGAKYAKAEAKKNELQRSLKAAVEDKNRRYHIWRLGNYYGYIRDPDMFVRLGYAWARSGRPGDALTQIKRAIDFVPTDKRTVLLNMMASLYASDNDHRKSRSIYESILAKNSRDHDALIGLMRLELLDGNSSKALEYLQQAAKAGGESKRTQIELAMVAMMKNDLTGAKELLRKVTDADVKDLQAWSLLAAVTMQQIDAAKESREKAKLEKELESVILPSMEKQARGPFDYYVQTTKAFLLMRKGAERRREARDAFVAAAKSRPDIAATQDLILGLDISLNDTVEAERHAREVLRRNRNAPLANYVMGSLALRKNSYDEAEAFLRKAADAPKPVPLALNDLAEVLRRRKSFSDAERYARLATKTAPKLYVAWETLGAILMDAKGDLGEAEMCIKKACELSRDASGKEEDVRMLISLARVQLLNGDKSRARLAIRKVGKRIDELSEFERNEFEELKRRAR